MIDSAWGATLYPVSPCALWPRCIPGAALLPVTTGRGLAPSGGARSWRRGSASFRRRSPRRVKLQRRPRSGTAGRGKEVRTGAGKGGESWAQGAPASCHRVFPRSRYRPQEGAHRAAAEAQEGERGLRAARGGAGGRPEVAPRERRGPGRRPGLGASASSLAQGVRNAPRLLQAWKQRGLERGAFPARQLRAAKPRLCQEAALGADLGPVDSSSLLAFHL